MKQKFIYIILLQIFFSIRLFAQIPNSDFESWTFWGWYYNPDGWNTNNSQISSSFVSPDSDAFNGNLAMRLYNFGSVKPLAIATFAHSSNITAFSAYVKLTVIYNDTVSIIIRELYNGIAVDSGTWTGITDILNYSSVIIPISQNSNLIDSVEIEIAGGNKTNLIFEGTSFFVDNLELNPASIIIDDPPFSLQNIYPNPVQNILYIPLNDIKIPIQIKIFDSKGGEMKNYSLDRIDLSMLQQGFCVSKIDLHDFAEGVYLLQLNASTIRNYKFIKQ